MPRLMTTNPADMETGTIAGMSAFTFSGKRIEHLTSTEYTLVTIAVDMTGSVSGFATELRAAMLTAINSCRKSPRANNLLVRVLVFNTSVGVLEVHGFKPLQDIKDADYPPFTPYGGTNLYDAGFSAVGGTNAYSEKLMSKDYLANGIVFLITDGDDNQSTATTTMVKAEMERGGKAEVIESLIVVLVGINAGMYKGRLDTLANETGARYLDVADATPGKLAKLADFVSQSISSQSQALGSGGPSQNISAVI